MKELLDEVDAEWIQDLIDRIDMYGRGAGYEADDVLILARIALAVKQASSRKLFTCSACGAEGLDEPLESRCHCNEDGAHWVESKLYTAPPAPDLSILKRYDLDMSNCDSCGQDCGADMSEELDGDYVLFADVVSMFAAEQKPESSQ